jgi:hypothetical protein
MEGKKKERKKERKEKERKKGKKEERKNYLIDRTFQAVTDWILK